MRTPHSCRAVAIRLSLTLLALGVAWGAALEAQMDPPVWEKEFSRVHFIRSMSDGQLIVGADGGGLMSLNPATGEAVWSRPEIRFFGMGTEFDQLAGTPYGILHQGDLRRGFDSLQFTVIDLRSGATKYSAGAMARGFWSLPSAGLGLVWDWRRREKQDWDELGGRMVLIKLEDGARVWEKTDFFTKEWKADLHRGALIGRNQAPVMDTDSTMIELMGEKGVRRIHVASGRVLWATPVKFDKSNPAPYYGYAPILLDRAAGVVYVPGGDDLTAIRSNDGSLVWKERRDLPGAAHRMEIIPEGLLVQGGPERNPDVTPESPGRQLETKGSPFITLINPATGEHVWKRPYRDLGDAATNYVLKDGKLYVWSNNRITAINLVDGEGAEVTKLPSLKEDDVATSLQATERGWLVAGAANVILAGYDGKLVHHLSYKRPGVGFAQKVVGGMINFGVGRLAEKNTGAAGEVARSGGVGAGDPRELEMRQARATQAAQNFYMYTEIERDGKKRAGFVRVNGVTGDVQSVITDELLKLGAFSEKYPGATLEFDPAEGRMFFKYTAKNTGHVGMWRFGATR